MYTIKILSVYKYITIKNVLKYHIGNEYILLWIKNKNDKVYYLDKDNNMIVNIKKEGL